MNDNLKALVIDLDGTLLHDEPEVFSVSGRSGNRYMSQTCADILSNISTKMPVIIATGRNAQSVGKLVNQLEEISFSGFILENGLIARTSLYKKTQNIDNQKDQWSDLHDMLPGWERLYDYENCLGLIVPCDETKPKKRVMDALNYMGKNAHLYQENNKLFVYPFLASKLQGILALRFNPFIVIGDEINDMDMLAAGSYSGTLASANSKVREFICEQGTYCSQFSSHQGSEDLLKWAQKIIGDNNV